VAAAVIMTATARAGPRDHESGFLLRLAAGVEMTDSRIAAADARVWGTAGALNVAIGGIILPNLALHGTLWGWTALNPAVTQGSIGGEPQEAFGLGAYGGGLTYYVMPANIYLSGSFGVGVLQLDASGIRGSTDAGIAVDISLGKEWWVGDMWGLGVAAAFGYYSATKGGGDDDPLRTARWKGKSIGLRFTATVN